MRVAAWCPAQASVGVGRNGRRLRLHRARFRESKPASTPLDQVAILWAYPPPQRLCPFHSTPSDRRLASSSSIRPNPTQTAGKHSQVLILRTEFEPIEQRNLTGA